MTVTQGTTSRILRGLVALIAALAVPLGAQLAIPETASAASTYRAIASPCLNMRTSPSGPIIACIPYGTYIALQCVTPGPRVTGPYRASSMWYRTSWAGKTGYSSDAWIYTGTSAAVAPNCSTTPTATRETKAVNWATSMIGSNDYKMLCGQFVANAYGMDRLGKDRAIDAFYALRNAGQMRYTTTPPRVRWSSARAQPTWATGTFKSPLAMDRSSPGACLAPLCSAPGASPPAGTEHTSAGHLPPALGPVADRRQDPRPQRTSGPGRWQHREILRSACAARRDDGRLAHRRVLLACLSTTSERAALQASETALCHGGRRRASGDRYLNLSWVIGTLDSSLGSLRLERLVSIPAAIYVRISRDLAGQRLGVTRQRKDCEALVKAKGWSVWEVYEDNDVSATKGTPRPSYERMMAAVDRGDVKALVVWDVDRLTRTPRELEDVIDYADRKGLQLASVGGEIDLATEQGRMLARMKGTVARFEVEQQRRRLRAKHKEMAANGVHIGPRPFGWSFTDDRTLVLNESDPDPRVERVC